MEVKNAGTYRLLEDLTLRGETNTPATFKAGMLLTISHIDLVKKQVLGPAIPGWQFWELPVELIDESGLKAEPAANVDDAKEIYKNDPAFRLFVNGLISILKGKTLTADQILTGCVLAVGEYEHIIEPKMNEKNHA